MPWPRVLVVKNGSKYVFGDGVRNTGPVSLTAKPDVAARGYSAMSGGRDRTISNRCEAHLELSRIADHGLIGIRA